MGNILEAEGCLSDAMHYYKKDLEISQKLADETETVEALRDLFVSYNKLGDILKAEGCLSDAMHYYKKALEIRKKLADETHTAESYDDLAVSYYKLSLVDTAKKNELLDQAISIYEMLTENCPNITRFRNNLNVLKSFKK